MSVAPRSLSAAATELVATLGPESAVGVGVFDARLRCLVASPALLALGGGAGQVLPPAVADTLLASLAAVRDGAPSIRHPELAGADPVGPVYRAGCYRLDWPDEPLLAVLVADITERVRTQRRVRENRERLELAERLALVGAWTWGFIAVPTVLPGEDLDFLRAVANVLGNAIARLRLEAELTEQAEARGRLIAEALDAEDRTRREISETLHDGPLQDLLALNQFVARLEPADDREAMHLSRARAELTRAIGGLREVMLELHPVLLDVGGLESALTAIAAQQGRLGDFHADVRIEAASCGIRDELVLSLARELLVNVAKHARASRVEVSVRRSDDGVVLVVADDGCGMPAGRLAAALREGHVGLASTRQRVEAVGGRLVLSTAPGSGTQVTAVLPDR